ncbi:hypothetical protein HDV05_006974 [Chytridiales sp. JEL 0842]|nr:hypothetical protein HDV05_006974 [Chytridiales sp. JEL 0842]
MTTITDPSILAELYAKTSNRQYPSCRLVKAFFPMVQFAEDCCEDQRLKCTRNKKEIEEINLKGTPLNMPFPGLLLERRNIKLLNLERTGVYGELPPMPPVEGQVGFYGEHFYLAHNKLTGLIPDWTSLLFVLDLRDNDFYGPVPPGFGSLGVVVDVSFNRLNGTLPDSFSTGRLKEFHLNDNQFTGRIPEGVQWVDEFKKISLQNNRFFGTLPTLNANLTSLRAENNCFKGTEWKGHPLGLQFPYATNCKPSAPNGPPLTPAPRNPVAEVKPTYPPYKPDYDNESPVLDHETPECIQLSRAFPQLNLPDSSVDEIACCSDSRLRCDADGYITHILFANQALNTQLTEVIGNLQNLEVLNLENTGIFGPLPRELPYNVRMIKVGNNKLTGNFPPSWLFNHEFNVLDVHNNMMSGVIPMQIWEDTFILDFSNNYFTGPLPLAFDTILNATQILRFNNNRFVGNPFQGVETLPEVAHMDLSNNLFTGSLPLLQSTRLRTFNVLGNCFDGIPANQISLGFQYPPSNCETDEDYVPFLSPRRSEAMNSTYPDDWDTDGLLIYDLETDYPYEFLQTDRDCTILKEAFPTLKFNEECCVGDLRVTCNEGLTITELDLRNVNVGGVLPEGVSRLLWLTNLNLESTGVSGQIPASYAKLTYLRQINLSRNNLTGPVPEIFSNMWMLNTVQIQNNTFTGTLPSKLGNTVSLFDASYNEFVGSIPESWSTAERLNEVILNDNLLSGTIPKGLSSLRVLQSLVISRNRINGTVPEFASPYLRNFNASFNCLIPGRSTFNLGLQDTDNFCAVDSNLMPLFKPGFHGNTTNPTLVSLIQTATSLATISASTTTSLATINASPIAGMIGNALGAAIPTNGFANPTFNTDPSTSPTAGSPRPSNTPGGPKSLPEDASDSNAGELPLGAVIGSILGSLVLLAALIVMPVLKRGRDAKKAQLEQQLESSNIIIDISHPVPDPSSIQPKNDNEADQSFPMSTPEPFNIEPQPPSYSNHDINYVMQPSSGGVILNNHRMRGKIYNARNPAEVKHQHVAVVAIPEYEGSSTLGRFKSEKSYEKDAHAMVTVSGSIFYEESEPDTEKEVQAVEEEWQRPINLMEADGRIMELTEIKPFEWSVDDVGLWLSSFGAPQRVLDVFREQQVDGTRLISLTNDALRCEVGLRLYGDRFKIERRLELLKIRWNL